MTQQQYIGLVHTDTGHWYIGPGTYADVVSEAQWAIAGGDTPYQDSVSKSIVITDPALQMTSIHVLPYDVDDYPCGDADQAGEYFTWYRDQ